VADVCILLPSHWDVARGGSEYRARVLAECLAADGRHRVTYLARRAPPDASHYGYRIARFRGPQRFASLKWGRFLESAALYRALVGIDPDVIVQFVACAYTGVAAWYARRAGKSMIWCVCHDLDLAPVPDVGITSPSRLIDRLLFRYGVRNATQILTQTDSQAGTLWREYRREAAAVVPNFHEMVVGPICKSRMFTVLWVGNIKAGKRPELFLELAARFAGRKNVRFRMIGRPEDSPWGCDLIRSIQRLDNVEYLGELEMDEVNALLVDAHVLVNTSRFEGLPNTFIQAWLREVPVLSLGVDPDGVIGSHGMGGVAGDMECLTSMLSGFIAEPTRARAMGVAARAFAETNYAMANVERMVEHIEALAVNSQRPQLHPEP
jgi:glycosyltransferase involved in cell wall biosynthesis